MQPKVPLGLIYLFFIVQTPGHKVTLPAAALASACTFHPITTFESKCRELSYVRVYMNNYQQQSD